MTPAHTSEFDSPDPVVVVIVGPTAVGKTEISVEVALRLDGEIVSADSRLFYRGMDIGTAKPSAEQRRQVAHHLIDIADPDANLSLAEFQNLAHAAIMDISRRGHLPLLVGGSGQYVSAVVEGWRPPAVPPNSILREELERLSSIRGPQWLHHNLERLDPVAAARVHPRNTRRTIRALEVMLTTGRRFSEARSRSSPPYRLVRVGLWRSRDELFERIDQRVEAMFRAGLEAETRRLLANGYRPTLPAMSAIGYAECVDIIEGRSSVDQAKARIKKASRVYVRHQANWFKKSDPEIRWFEAGRPDVAQSVVEHIRTTISGHPEELPRGEKPS